MPELEAYKSKWEGGSYDWFSIYERDKAIHLLYSTLDVLWTHTVNDLADPTKFDSRRGQVMRAVRLTMMQTWGKAIDQETGIREPFALEQLLAVLEKEGKHAQP